MGLQEYKRKRDFEKTPEPEGAVRPATGNSFVVQKHAASRLHYDFRLELDGVLKSWAVPKGPSLDPGEKRLAVHVEDHPLEYGTFEGVIPKGEYGGGTVLLWDRGTWQPDGDPVYGYRKGHLRFHLDGEKLRGAWDLVRMHGRQAGENEQNWILIKVADEEARPGSDDAIVEEKPESVASGLGLDEIAADPERVWRSDHEEKVVKKVVGKKMVEKTVKKDPAEIGGVRITHPDRVLYPDMGLTKGELALYYERVAEWILPHLSNRPLSLVRCPEGRQKQCFYQKHVTAQFPKAVRRVEIEEEGGGTELYGAVDSLTGLISLIQMGALELHVWGCHRDAIEKPDSLVFDLDPDAGLDWQRVTEGAVRVRERLQELGLDSYLKTTGGKGLHVCVPLARRQSWDDVKAFARAVAESIADDEPERYTAKMPKASRKGKIFIDYLRNGRGATSICPYSTRARPGAPVSTPLFWEELALDVRSGTFGVRNLPVRLETLPYDPWKDFSQERQSITAAMKKAVRSSGRPRRS